MFFDYEDAKAFIEEELVPEECRDEPDAHIKYFNGYLVVADNKNGLKLHAFRDHKQLYALTFGYRASRKFLGLVSGDVIDRIENKERFNASVNSPAWWIIK